MTWVLRVAGGIAAALGLFAMNAATAPSWPKPTGDPEAADAALVRSLPVCIASDGWSAGELGPSVLYRIKREGRTMTVGYFVYWTTERPWGTNLLSYLVVPALLVDAVYTHFLFVLPGAQRVIYGPGDVEGARVVYQQTDDGRWSPVAAVADDSAHREITLARADFVDGEGRVLLTTHTWSHQFGDRGVPGRPPPSPVCFAHQRLAPLSADVARTFRLGSPEDPRRAPPAWRF
jgi:hypothetical protein